MSNQKTIYIIGAGAIGKALAVILTLENKDVILIRGTVDDKPAQKEKIHVELADRSMLSASIEVSTWSNLNTLSGVIVLANKSFGNKDISQKLRGKTGNSPIVVMQNGLGVEQLFVDSGFSEIYRCVLFATSQVVSHDMVRFKHVMASPIGLIKGDVVNLAKTVELLGNSKFPFRVEPDIQPIIWKKVIANSVFNSICPLLEIDNGIFHRNKEAMAIAHGIIYECVAVAQEKGIALTVEEVADSILLISKSSDGQLISTLQDIKNKRKTEIETLNFSIVDIAKKLGKEELVTETRLLGELTRLKSSLNR